MRWSLCLFSGSLASLSSCTIFFCVGFIVFICGSFTSFLPCSLFSFFFFLKVIRCQSASMICLLCSPAVSSHLIDLKLRPRRPLLLLAAVVPVLPLAVCLTSTTPPPLSPPPSASPVPTASRDHGLRNSWAYSFSCVRVRACAHVCVVQPPQPLTPPHLDKSDLIGQRQPGWWWWWWGGLASLGAAVSKCIIDSVNTDFCPRCLWAPHCCSLLDCH